MESKLTKIGYELKDIGIVQSGVSEIDTPDRARAGMTICGRPNTLPVFAAPVPTVVDGKNWGAIRANAIIPVVPASAYTDSKEDFAHRISTARQTFVSFSLAEAELMTHNNIKDLSYECHTLYQIACAYQTTKVYICIETEQGNSKRLFDVCRELKRQLGDHIEIMTGGVSSPSAYRRCRKCGIDWVRVSPGASVRYPMATLLDEIHAERRKTKRLNRIRRLFFLKPKHIAKVIADGCVDSIDDIAKCLVLGADAVMCDKILNGCEEAAYEAKFALNEEEFMKGNVHLSQNKGNTLKRYRPYYAADGSACTTEVKFKLVELARMIETSIRSCMAHTDCENLDELRNKPDVIVFGNGDGKCGRLWA